MEGDGGSAGDVGEWGAADGDLLLEWRFFQIRFVFIFLFVVFKIPTLVISLYPLCTCVIEPKSGALGPPQNAPNTVLTGFVRLL